jgi:hypothetical protein
VNEEALAHWGAVAPKRKKTCSATVMTPYKEDSALFGEI